MESAAIRQELDHKLQIRKTPTGCRGFLLPKKIKPNFLLQTLDQQ
jgi:hypothetical protein